MFWDKKWDLSSSSSFLQWRPLAVPSKWAMCVGVWGNHNWLTVSESFASNPIWEHNKKQKQSLGEYKQTKNRKTVNETGEKEMSHQTQYDRNE